MKNVKASKMAFLRRSTMLLTLRLLCAGLAAFTPRAAFAEARFSFDKYCEPADMANALRQLVPRGTSRSVAEARLVKEGGASIHPDERRPNVFHYEKHVDCDPENTQWSITVMYDAHGDVWQIHPQSPVTVFPLEPPSDRNDETIFSFDDYRTAADLALTLHELFPLGTAKSDIEKVLVQWGQATPFAKVDDPQQVIYNYRFTFPAGKKGGVSQLGYGAWNISADYSGDNTLSQIFVAGPSVSQVFNQKEWHAYFVPKHKPYEKQKREQHP